MTFYVTDQNTVVVFLVILGVIFGLASDIVKVKRHFIPTGKLIRFTEDFLYCILCTFLYQITVFVLNYGYVRWYEFAGVMVGYLLYVLLFEDAFMHIIIWIVNKMLRILSILMRPFVRLRSMAVKCIRRSYARISDKVYSMTLKKYSDKVKKKIAASSKQGFMT